MSRLDQIWEKPSDAVMRDVLAAARHQEPLVRRAACEALGRVGDARAVEPLVELLGDRNKIVRHGAAWALRELASRKGLGLKEIAQALNSHNDYVRRGAVFVFAQHFAYLTRDGRGFASTLIQRLNDPDIFVRLYATRALWQWFYWTDDDTVRQQIVDAYLARMSVPEHPWVRRNLVEGFYNICDENVRYLYNNWIPLLAQPEDRERATRAHRATVTMLAEKIANALMHGNDLQREAILRGLTDFHLRKSSDRFGYGVVIDAPNNLYARIGNDIETVKFYEEATPLLEAALLKMLDHPAHRRPAIIASYTLRDNKTVLHLPLRFLREIAMEPNGGVRETMWEYFRFLPLNITPQNKAEFTALVTAMMTGYREARLAAFDTLKRAGAALQDDPQLVAALKAYMASDAAPSWKMQLLSALNGMPRLHEERETKLFVRSALLGDDEGALRAAVSLALSSPTLENDPLVRNTLQALVRDADTAKRLVLLDVLNRDTRTLNSLQALSLVAESLQDKNATVRQRALNVVQKSQAMQQNPAIRLALSNLLKDPNDRIAAAANSGLAGTPAPTTLGDGAKYLDYEFFKARIQPILTTAVGSDGKSCAHCHSTHTILRLHRPDERGHLTEEQTRDNYFSALKVVNLLEPEKSLLLQKPLADATTEGILHTDKIPHGGGKRWDGPDSAAYQAVLAWIQGAKN
ncbi:MAG: HEAT repeat domain-containing protein [Abditibacteriales bacterium]|nr:HEAT repeat domain-containing protein [Abditibacteriales bacterium]